MRILVVDKCAAFVRKALPGHEVHTAHEASPAISKLRTLSFNLVIVGESVKGLTPKQLVHVVAALQPEARRVLLTHDENEPGDSHLFDHVARMPVTDWSFIHLKETL